jgi:uncharacterized metal-binding protein
MASGRAHTAVSIFAAGIGAAAINGFAKSSAGLATGYLNGCLADLAITSDLDMINQTAAHRYIRYFYRYLAALWRLIWLPHAIAIPHRSFLSHFPLVSTIGRLVYLGIPGMLIANILNLWPGDRTSEWIAQSHNITLIISTTSHKHAC